MFCLIFDFYVIYVKLTQIMVPIIVMVSSLAAEFMISLVFVAVIAPFQHYYFRTPSSNNIK